MKNDNLNVSANNMKSMDVDIVVPVFNKIDYTKKCLGCLIDTIKVDGQILVINNGSTDGTAEFLANLTNISVINNSRNLGVAAAWNQGVMAGQSEWVVLLNNDVILPDGWLESLIGFAVDENMDIVSPAIREGDYNYDIAEYSRRFTQMMRCVVRRGVADGICFAVRRKVFEKIGTFDESFCIGQFEDTDFFRRASSAGFSLGITGRSFIHHFGSVTQKAHGRSYEKSSYEKENRAYFYKKWNLTRWKRFWRRRHAKIQDFIWRTNERFRFGHSLKEKWMNGKLYYY